MPFDSIIYAASDDPRDSNVYPVAGSVMNSRAVLLAAQPIPDRSVTITATWLDAAGTYYTDYTFDTDAIITSIGYITEQTGAIGVFQVSLLDMTSGMCLIQMPATVQSYQGLFNYKVYAGQKLRNEIVFTGRPYSTKDESFTLLYYAP